MLIVDAQIHLWNAGNPTTPWHRQIPAYTKADALAEVAQRHARLPVRRHPRQSAPAL